MKSMNLIKVVNNGKCTLTQKLYSMSLQHNNFENSKDQFVLCQLVESIEQEKAFF